MQHFLEHPVQLEPKTYLGRSGNLNTLATHELLGSELSALLLVVRIHPVAEGRCNPDHSVALAFRHCVSQSDAAPMGEPLIQLNARWSDVNKLQHLIFPFRSYL